MGAQNSISLSRSASAEGPGPKLKPMKEKDKYGHCLVKISIPSPAGSARATERFINHVITPKGGIIHGTQSNPQLIYKAMVATGYPFLPPSEIPLIDSRAHKVLVTYTDGWFVIPSPEVFSRHSGTCVILGDRVNSSAPYKIKLGDCFRLGSVGLVVSEMRIKDGEEQRLDAKKLQYLKEESLTLDAANDLAALAADENDQERGSMPRQTSDGQSVATEAGWNEEHGGIGNGEKFICYMCYETEDTPEDPLVAPCDCKGDTRYLHVSCLQKWYQSSVCGPQSQVIRTTGNGAPACKICGSAYKTAFRKADGRKANLLEIESSRPYISLVVVTRHDTNPGLFNTKFRLNFGRLEPILDPVQELIDNSNELLIGRSSTCNMILDYRTVSTIHARVFYENGEFFIQDRRSSNGTMVYLQEPWPLQFSQPVRLRMGRTTLSLQAKRSVTATIKGMFSRGRNQASNPQQRSAYLSSSELLTLMAGTGLMSAYSGEGEMGDGLSMPSRFDMEAMRSLGDLFDPNDAVIAALLAADAAEHNNAGANAADNAVPSSRLAPLVSSSSNPAIGASSSGRLPSPSIHAGGGSGILRADYDDDEKVASKLADRDGDKDEEVSEVAAFTVTRFTTSGKSLGAEVKIAKSATLSSEEAFDDSVHRIDFNGFETDSAAYLEVNGNYTYAAAPTQEPNISAQDINNRRTIGSSSPGDLAIDSTGGNVDADLGILAQKPASYVFSSLSRTSSAKKIAGSDGSQYSPPIATLGEDEGSIRFTPRKNAQESASSGSTHASSSSGAQALLSVDSAESVDDEDLAIRVRVRPSSRPVSSVRHTPREATTTADSSLSNAASSAAVALVSTAPASGTDDL